VTTKNVKRQPIRVSDEELRKSRAGTLGRFPSEDLYEPESDERIDKQRLRKTNVPHTQNEKRKRSALVSVE